MRSGVKTAALFLLSLVVSGAAQASELTVTERDISHRIADYDLDEVDESPDDRDDEPSYEHRRSDTYEGRSAPRLGEKRSFRSESRRVPLAEPQAWERRVITQRRWGADCRVIIKERVNRWGDLVEIRRKVCG